VVQFNLAELFESLPGVAVRGERVAVQHDDLHERIRKSIGIACDYHREIETGSQDGVFFWSWGQRPLPDKLAGVCYLHNRGEYPNTENHMGQIVSIVYTPSDIPPRPPDHYARVPVESVVLKANRGIDGDRKGSGRVRHLNIMAAETLEQLR